MVVTVLYAFVAVLTLSAWSSEAQSFWDFGTVPYGEACAREGYNPGLPGLEDPWPLAVHCKTYNGTVGCVDSGAGYSRCECNQGEDAYFIGGFWNGSCVGKVNAACTLEHDDFFPDKNCMSNADCVPVQGEYRSIGKCQCLYGFKETADSMCVPDEDVEEGDRGTPRTTTTTEAAPREDFVFPGDLIISEKFVEYGEQCHSEAILNRTSCHTYGNTVSCRENTCQCNLGQNATFDQEANMCLGLVGSLCLQLEFPWGWKPCVSGADCVLWASSEGYGTCRCLHGYLVDGNGACVRDESIPNPSTQRPTRPPSTERPPPISTPYPNECPAEGFDKIEHPTECGVYIICVNGVPYEEECADDLQFNPETKECDFPENVNCTKMLPDCPPEGISFHPYPGNCSLYVICAEGTPLIQQCSPGLCFDPVELKCRANETSAFEIPYEHDIQDDSNIHHDEVSGCQQVKSEGVLLLSRVNSCDEFIICNQGEYKSTMKCQTGHAFDFESQSCIPIAMSTCKL